MRWKHSYTRWLVHRGEYPDRRPPVSDRKADR